MSLYFRSLLAGMVLALMAVFLFGCATHRHAIELGIGHDTHIDEGRNPQSVMRYRYEPSGSGWVVEFNHNSSIPNGKPFNRKEEDLSNQWSAIYRFVF